MLIGSTATLELTALERFDTLTTIGGNAINVAVGCLSIGIAAWGGAGAASLAGWTYLLLFPLLTATTMAANRRRLRFRPAAAPD